MSESIVFTFVGKDKPGLVEQLANIVSSHQGNWLESRMNHLAGQFAGIGRVQVPQSQAEALVAALAALDGKELRLQLIRSDQQNEQASHSNLLQLNVLGNDRPGIVRDLSQSLARQQINVLQMETNVSSAPMTAEPLFDAEVIIDCPAGLDREQLTDQLMELGDKLGVDIRVESEL